MNQEQSKELLNQVLARFFRIYVKAARVHVSPEVTGKAVMGSLDVYGEAKRAIEFLCNGGKDMSDGAIWDAGEAALKAIGEQL